MYTHIHRDGQVNLEVQILQSHQLFLLVQLERRNNLNLQLTSTTHIGKPHALCPSLFSHQFLRFLFAFPDTINHQLEFESDYNSFRSVKLQIFVTKVRLVCFISSIIHGCQSCYAGPRGQGIRNCLAGIWFIDIIFLSFAGVR